MTKARELLAYNAPLPRALRTLGDGLCWFAGTVALLTAACFAVGALLALAGHVATLAGAGTGAALLLAATYAMVPVLPCCLVGTVLACVGCALGGQ